MWRAFRGVTFIVFLCFIQTLSAQNLVPNHSFESDSNLFCSWVTDPFHFDGAVKNWSLPTMGSSDLYSLKLTDSCFSHPFSKDSARQGSQLPHSGNNMAGIFVYGPGCINGLPNYREYVQIQLKEPLVLGKEYIVGMFASLADSSTYAVQDLAFYFSDTRIQHYVECEMLDFEPHATARQMVKDKQGWVKICESFTATSAAEYLIIGSFKDDSSATIEAVMDSTKGNQHAYYYIDDVYVIPQKPVSVDLGPDKISCKNNPAELDAGTDSAEFLWLLPDNTTVNGRKIMAKDPGIYYLKALFCDTVMVDSIRISHYPVPQANAGPDTAICFGQTVQLQGSGGVTYLWSPADFLDDPMSAKPTSSTPGTRKYILTVSDTFGCTSTDTVLLLVKPELAITTAENFVLCQGDSINFSATTLGGNTANHQLYWIDNKGDTLHIGKDWKFLPKTSDSIKVVLEDGCSKAAITYVKFKLNAKPLANFGQFPISGCAPLAVQFTASDTLSGAVYLWNFGDGKTSTEKNPQHIYSQPGSYLVELQVVSASGCTNKTAAKDSIKIFGKPMAKFSFSPEKPTTEDNLITFKNESAGAANYEWYVNNDFFSNEKDPLYTFTQSGTYTFMLIAKNASGCADTAVLSLEVEDVFSVFIPNAFSPNADAANNIFEPRIEGVQSYNMLIYNRWGEKMYEGLAWDGTFKNETVEEGVYLYMIFVKEKSGRNSFYKGTLTLIR